MAMCSKGKHMTRPTITEKAKPFYNEIKITNTCTWFEGWMQNFKEPAVEGDIQMVYCSD
jgi:hypothetical protein